MRGWSSAVLLGIPLLFGAVWIRVAIADALRERDTLNRARENLAGSVLELTGQRSRLSTWSALEPRAAELGLHEPSATQVRWIAVGRAVADD